jgi:hypothetical protein
MSHYLRQALAGAIQDAAVVSADAVPDGADELLQRRSNWREQLCQRPRVLCRLAKPCSCLQCENAKVMGSAAQLLLYLLGGCELHGRGACGLVRWKECDLKRGSHARQLEGTCHAASRNRVQQRPHIIHAIKAAHVEKHFAICIVW